MFSSLRNMLLQHRSYLLHPAFSQSVAWITDGSKYTLTDIDASLPLSASMVVLVAGLVSSSLADGDACSTASGDGSEITLKWQLLLQRPTDAAFRTDFDHAVDVLRLLQQRMAGPGEACQGLLIDKGPFTQVSLHTDISLGSVGSFKLHDVDDECCDPLDIIYQLDGALIEVYFGVQHSTQTDRGYIVNNFEGKIEHLIVLDRRSGVLKRPSMDECIRASRCKLLRLN
ncbi:hypothetical protein BD779DRAFT_1675680 [Infundibulicybe gibba]|nr:hypothetical protein BD779DRAFT_1675680 [Infundibulicybe gibba]